MRLSPKQTDTIQSAVHQVFGPDTSVWLFGSRVDDKRRGGDYDFYLECGISDADEIVQRKLSLLVLLDASPEFEGEKIDIVIRPRYARLDLPIYQVARTEGVRL